MAYCLALLFSMRPMYYFPTIVKQACLPAMFPKAVAATKNNYLKYFDLDFHIDFTKYIRNVTMLVDMFVLVSDIKDVTFENKEDFFNLIINEKVKRR